MSALGLLAGAGWLAAAAALVVTWWLRAEGERRMSLVAQAAHELRAPLGAALLGLHGVIDGAAGARRVAGVELELRRAGLALADLDAAPRGRRAPGCVEAVDVRALLAEAVEAWRPLAAALAAELHLDPAGPRLVVRADRLRLTQAVGNVVLNALEHGVRPGARARPRDAARTPASRCATTARACRHRWERSRRRPPMRAAAATGWRSRRAPCPATAAGC